MERTEIIKQMINMLGYDVTYQQVEEFLKDKKIITPNNNNSVYVPRSIASNKGILNNLKQRLKEYGYNFPEEQINQYFNKLSSKQLNILTMRLTSPDLVLDQYTIEQLFSEIDFFGLKQTGQYQTIINSDGQYYFRIMPQKLRTTFDCRIYSAYDILYKRVSHEGSSYLVALGSLSSERNIVYISPETFAKEFTEVATYLHNFEHVGKIAYKDIEGKKARGCPYTKEDKNVFHILYKSQDMLISKTHFTKGSHRGLKLCSINVGNYYVADDWAFRGNSTLDYTIDRAIEEIKSRGKSFTKKPGN